MNTTAMNFLLESGKTLLVTTLVILANCVIGLVLVNKFYSFFLAAFFFLYIPVWLIAFGIIFQTKWKWYSMMAGSFLSVFMVSMGFFAASEDAMFRFANSVGFAMAGSFLTAWGWLIRYLSNSIRKTIVENKKRKQDPKNPTPFGL